MRPELVGDDVDAVGRKPAAAGVFADRLFVVPARRRSATLANPAGLTARQVDVLRLLDDGLTNVELADRLFLSVKTVDHHVSAILAKLEVNKRRDAVRKARELGILTGSDDRRRQPEGALRPEEPIATRR